MNDANKSQSLIFHAIEHAAELLGWTCPRNISMFLGGAGAYFMFSEESLPGWRIYGPLDDALNKHFVDATGHPSLSTQWPTALEITHLNSEFAVAKLLQKLDERAITYNVHDSPALKRFDKLDECSFWDSFTQRPGMYGPSFGWDLYCFLLGMTYGIGWLGMPKLKSAETVFEQIKKQSTNAYGSEFGAFRVYHDSAKLLGWIDLADSLDSTG